MRDIDRLRAMEQAAMAQQKFSRLAGLAQRADELAEAYARRWNGSNAAAVQDLRAFHCGLASLSQATVAECEQARANADLCDTAAAAANRKRDVATERVAATNKGLGKQRIARSLSDSPQLARSMNKLSLNTRSVRERS
ncbi:MAG: hypothetical protein WA908_04795 [Pontixanthobacter sp.]